uniref:Protein kinase domain-containing protein n=1 Tax=Rhabditophanes sp. KR3021 TaxID=114890 RepID=A0AC35TG80_9BILA
MQRDIIEVPLVNTGSIRMDEFSPVIERISEGSYGVVFKATWNRFGVEVAIKRITVEDMDGIPSTCLREVSILKELSHVNIVRLYDAFFCERKMYLIFEFIDADLWYVLKWRMQDQKLPVPYIKHFGIQICEALAYCHSRRIIHRDIKCENILIRRDNVVKMADFGLARTASAPMRQYTNEVVTIWYRPPELLLGTEFYTSSIDVWSVGCVLAECYTGCPLVKCESAIEQLLKTFELFGTPTDETWPGVEKYPDYSKDFPSYPVKSFDQIVPGLCSSFKDLLQSMLTYIPRQRIFATNAIKHPFFAGAKNELPPISTIFFNKTATT